MLQLRLLGGASLTTSSGAAVERAVQRRRLALLALLAVEPGRSMSRDKLIGYLWPDADSEHARHRLRDAVYALRGALGEDLLLGVGDELRLNSGRIDCDLWRFEDALARGDLAAAVAAYSGPLLDGFFVSGAPELERRVDRERERLAASYAAALEALASAAEGEGDYGRAAEWWKQRAAHDPYDSRVALRLMRASEASGNRAGALQHAGVHERLLQEDLGIEPAPELRAAIEALRAPPAPREVTGADSPAPGDGDGSGQPPARGASGPAPASLAPDAEGGGGGPPPESRAAPTAPRRRLALALALAGLGVAAVASPLLTGRSEAGGPIALEAEDAGTRPAPAVAIAVLPFANLSRDPGEEYFSDGLTEELIATLSRVRALRVAARTSSFAFKGENRDIREIGRVLNVAAVVEGSVRREGDVVRVTAQLVNVADGYHLWSGTFERRASDVLALQGELALRIANALAAEITPADRERVTRSQSHSPEAYTLYLKGRYFWSQRSGGGLERALHYFQLATEADPEYAAAYAGLASAYAPLTMHGFAAPWEIRARMRDAALEAVRLDDGLAEAHTALASYYYSLGWDWEAAEREFRQAIELDPGYPTAHMWYSYFLESMGRTEEAVREARAALALDPLAPITNAHLGVSLTISGRPDLAIPHLRNALELDSTFWVGHFYLGQAHETAGDLEEAHRAYERAAAFAGASASAKAGLARVLARTGREDEAQRMIQALRTQAERTGLSSPSVATAILALGDTDAALEWLEAAARQRHPNLLHATVEVGFAPLRDHPRFAALVRRVRLGS